jgi:16S rRNA (uracil1498-N3)-methyltransferase
MQVTPCADFAAAITEAAGKRLFLDEAGGVPLLSGVREAPEPYAICAGPEGGWTGQEREQALAAGWQATTLGENILRAETAALVAVSQLQGQWWSQERR